MTDEADARFVVHHGDNMTILPTLADCSVDAIVTDPPAGIAFMGKAWDSDKGGRDAWIAWLSEVMGQCLRVLKPGGHALVWAIPRTSHWTGMAIENAGFEVRDRIAHCFGSGFPKSLDVSKAIDKHGGQSVAWFGPWLRAWREANGVTQKEVATLFPSKTGGLTGCVANWELGLNMPTPDQFNAIRDRFALPFDSLEVLAREVLRQSAGTRLSFAPGQREDMVRVTLDITAPATDAARQWQGWGTALKPAIEDWWLARKPLVGNVAQNVLAHGTGALNIDACRVEADGGSPSASRRAHGNSPMRLGEYGRTFLDRTSPERYMEARAGEAIGRWPANLIHSGEPEVLAAFPDGRSSGMYAAKDNGRESGNKVTNFGAAGTPATMYADSGSAARFFMQCPPDEATSLFYTPKASRADRDKGNTHSTVKPIALMRYLCRLITPPDGVVLDPFAGSGSSGQAAMFEGFRFIGIEQDAGHVDLARHRVGLAARNGWQPGLDLGRVA